MRCNCSGMGRSSWSFGCACSRSGRREGWPSTAASWGASWAGADGLWGATWRSWCRRGRANWSGRPTNNASRCCACGPSSGAMPGSRAPKRRLLPSCQGNEPAQPERQERDGESIVLLQDPGAPPSRPMVVLHRNREAGLATLLDLHANARMRRKEPPGGDPPADAPSPWLCAPWTRRTDPSTPSISALPTWPSTPRLTVTSCSPPPPSKSWRSASATCSTCAASACSLANPARPESAGASPTPSIPASSASPTSALPPAP